MLTKLQKPPLLSKVAKLLLNQYSLLSSFQLYTISFVVYATVFSVLVAPLFYLYRVFLPNCIESIQFVVEFPVAILFLFRLYTIWFVVYAALFSVLVAIFKFYFVFLYYDAAGSFTFIFACFPLAGSSIRSIVSLVVWSLYSSFNNLRLCCLFWVGPWATWQQRVFVHVIWLSF